MDKILPIIVSFNPDDTIIKNSLSIIKQTKALLIIDNGSASKSLEYLKSLEKLEYVNIIYNKENLGIAAALNIGAKEAIQLQYDWLGTFDQDTFIPESYFKNLIEKYNAHHNKENVAIIFPIYKDQVTHLILNPSAERKYTELPMTSGSLIKTEIFNKIGFFEDSYFIDYVDHEFALRALQADFIILKAARMILEHNLGNIDIYSFLGKKFISTHHQAFRRYYITRNRIITWKRYFSFNPSWVFMDFFGFIKETAKIILIEENKLLKIKSIFIGFSHALSNTTGKYEL